ncbi:hypothetical protein IAT38_006192 [Cryptococcus sp. DSM 104549]
MSITTTTVTQTGTIPTAPTLTLSVAPKTTGPPGPAALIPPSPYARLLDRVFPPDDWRGRLKDDGYVVIPALSREKALEYRSRALGWVEAFGLGFDRNDPSTWTPDHMPVNHMGGMYTSEGYGLAHEQWIWDLKQEPGILGAFETLWGTDKLVTSFDGGAIMLPHPDLKTVGPKPEVHWEHIDLSPSRQGFFVAQSLINLNDNGPEDGGLLVMKGSSALMKKFFDQRGRPPIPAEFIDHYRFTLEEKQWFIDQGCEWIKVCADPGDLIIWDSATMHQNRPPSSDRDRVVHYICMGPADQLTEEDLAARARAWREQKPTTHTPFQGVVCRVYEPNRRADGSLCPVENKRIQPVKPTDKILKLVGIKPY